MKLDIDQKFIIDSGKNYPVGTLNGQMIGFSNDPAGEWNWMPTGKSITDLPIAD